MNLTDDEIFGLKARVKAIEDKFDPKWHMDSLQEYLKQSIDEFLSNSLTVSCMREEIERRSKRSHTELGEIAKKTKLSGKEVKSLRDQVQVLQDESVKIKNLQHDILIDLKLKAYAGDLSRVERMLDTKCSIATINEMLSMIKTLAKQEELVETQKDVKDLERKMEEEYFNRQEADRQLEIIQDKVIESLETYASVDEVRKLKEISMKKHSKVKESIQEHVKSFTNYKESITRVLQSLKTDINACAGPNDIEKLSLEISEKTSKADFTRYLLELSPKITAFQSELTSFKTSISDQEIALQRFDEILLQKSSKLELQDLSKKLQSLLNQTTESKISEIFSVQSKIQSALSKLETSASQTQAEITEIQANLRKKFSEFVDIKLLKDSLQDMQTQVSYKADRTEFLKFLEDKAGCVELSHLSQSLEAVHRQIKLLAVQMGALEKISTPSGKMRNAERSQREYFGKITNRLINYVVNSRPTVDETPVNEELKAFLRLPLSQGNSEQRVRLRTPNRRFNYSFDQIVNQ